MHSIQNHETLSGGDSRALAFAGEPIVITSRGVSIVQVDGVPCSIDGDSATPSAPGFCRLRITGVYGELTQTFVVLPPAARDSKPLVGSVPPPREALPRQILRGCISDPGCTPTALERALAEVPDAVCGALIGKPSGESINFCLYGAPR